MTLKSHSQCNDDLRVQHPSALGRGEAKESMKGASLGVVLTNLTAMNSIVCISSLTPSGYSPTSDCLGSTSAPAVIPEYGCTFPFSRY
jgi:hypothetical protein